MDDTKDMKLPEIHADHEHGHEHASSSHPLMPWLSAAILIGTGVLFAYFLVSGDIRNYINTEFIAYTYIGAGILLLLGIYAVLSAAGRVRELYNAHFGIAAAAVFAVPLLFGIIVPSRPLGLDAVTDDIDAADIVARTDSTATSIVATENWSVLDWLASYYAIDDFTQLEGQPADVTGFVRRVPADGEEFFRVTRFMVSCCVADTISVDMPVQYTSAQVGEAALEDGQWVQVTGDVSIRDFAGDTRPFINSSGITLLEKAPEPSYLYP